MRAVIPGEGTPPPLPLSLRPTVSTMSSYDPRTPSRRPLDYVEFGPGLVDDIDRRLIGDTRRRKVLDLGCGAGHTAVGLARRGARVIATDSDAEQVAAARALAAEHGVAIEFHEAGPAELAFVRADQIDLAVSVWALSLVEDLDRVFRQVHRCVRAGGHVVVSLPHPALLTADPDDPTRVAQSWETRTPIGERHVHTAEDLVTAFTRTNFAVDVLLERHHGGSTPVTLLARARRLGA